MDPDPIDILKEALKLPPEASAALAGTLLENLDVHVDERAEAAWEAEIARRVREWDAGSVRAVPWAEARRQIAGE